MCTKHTLVQVYTNDSLVMNVHDVYVVFADLYFQTIKTPKYTFQQALAGISLTKCDAGTKIAIDRRDHVSRPHHCRNVLDLALYATLSLFQGMQYYGAYITVPNEKKSEKKSP